MTAHVTVNQLSPAFAAPLEVLELRAWARAVLFFIGEFDMPEAVDPLQAYALRSGLVACLGQDRVQATIAENFWTPPQ